MTSHSVSPSDLGDRLRDARRARGLSQETVAEELGMSRPTLIAIEKGRRAVTPRELTVLSGLYGRSVHEITRPTPSIPPLAASFRASDDEADAGALAVVSELERLAGDVAEVETLTGTRMPRAFPDVYDISGPSPEAAADQVAMSERQRLGLGDAPLRDLRDTLEGEVGIRVFCFDMPSSIAGLFALAEPTGACIGINAKHPYERQRWTMAHEYGHFLTQDRWSTEVTRLELNRPKGAERFAEAFAARLLMPATSVVRRFQSIRKSRGGAFTVPDLLHMASLFEVSVPAMALRLEDLGLVAGGWFHQDIQPRLHVGDARKRLGLDEVARDVELLPRHTRYLAVGAFLSGQISEGVLTRLFRTDRLTAREIVARMASSTEVDGSGQWNEWTLIESGSDD